MVTLFGMEAFGQIQPYAVKKKPDFVDPKFPGGKTLMLKYLKENTRYPEIAKQIEIEGVVQVRVTVKKDSTLGNIRVVRGIGAGCDEEAIRVIKSMPKWSPAERKGIAINHSIVIEVTFGERRSIIAKEVRTNYVFNQGVQLQKEEKHDAAIEKFTEAINMSPYIDSEAYYNRGVSFYYMQDMENACLDWSKGEKYEHELSIVMFEKYCSAK